MGAVAVDDLAALLAGYAPFDSLDPESLRAVAAAGTVLQFARGDLVHDGFTAGTSQVFLVIAGRVELWNNADQFGQPADENLGPGGVFGFSAMLTERSVGPRAVAVTDATVARIPSAVVVPAFTSRHGARFLAEQVSSANRHVPGAPAYSTLDELIVRQPLVVEPTTSAGEGARLMSDHGFSYAAVRGEDGRLGLIDDALLRDQILVAGRSPSTPASEVMDPAPPTAVLGDSAAEALILLLDRDADFLLVTDRAGRLRGVVAPRDFAVSPTTAGVSLNEQLRRAMTTEELEQRARRVPAMLNDLQVRGLVPGKVVAVYAAILDTIIRPALRLVFDGRPDLSVDAFTWLSLGSNGRREAVLSSDVDSAVAFRDNCDGAAIDRYRAAFADIQRELAAAGITADSHGATASRPAFSRTNAQWREAARQWMAEPVQNQGAMMTSLLVDGRPIHGDPGLPEVLKVFSDLRRHPGTMRLLLEASLSARAKTRSLRDLVARRDTINLKKDAVLPIVNTARWATLAVGSS